MKSIEEMELKSQNKNLVNPDGIYDSSAVNDSSWSLASVKNGVYTCVGRKDFTANAFALGLNVGNLKPNTTYTVSYKVDGAFYISRYVYSGFNNLWRVNKEIPVSNNTFTTPSNVTEVCIGLYYSSPRGRTVEISEIQVEEAPQKTNFKEFNQDKKDVRFLEPLRGIKDGVRDKIIKKDGKWVIERNCGDILLDGSDDEYWGRQKELDTDNTERYYIDNNSIAPGFKSVISNTLPTFKAGEKDNLTHLFIHNEVARIDIKKLKSDTRWSDVTSLKQWLKNNPIKVVYQLATPIYEPLSIEPTLNLYTETTYISNNSNIPAITKVTIDRVVNRAKEFSKIARLSPISENVERARMWINLMDESTLKDQLQESVNNIFDISDMVLERKTTSSNLDIYIKSENMLSLSLDTNSVTFDDYSGVEDMEMLGAVNLTINSSLPYQLNAYMSSEITNSDKSNTLPIDILNIRENSEADYKQFADTADKIVLKDGCVKGNNNRHSIDLKLALNQAHKADVYKTIIKFEAEQK